LDWNSGLEGGLSREQKKREREREKVGECAREREEEGRKEFNE
jgi:hypothetical protein